MYVGYEGDGGFLYDFGESGGIGLCGHRDSDKVAACGGEGF